MFYHPFSNSHQSAQSGSTASLDLFFGGNLNAHEQKDEIITENFFS